MRKGGRFLAPQPDKKGKTWLTVLVILLAVVLLVGAIGGVEYDVPVDMIYDDPYQDLHINIRKGVQTLNGEDAVQVLRYRHGYADGDIGRINAQQDFLMSLARQMLSLGNIPNLSKVIQVYEDNVTTNLSSGNVLFYATEFLKLKAENIQVLAGGAEFDIRVGESRLPLKLQITGIFNVYNVMAAVGAAMAEGVPAPIIKACMEEFTSVPGRFELVRGGQDFAVIVDYAHTPDGLENILHTARQIAKKRIITVFGCGGDRDNTKRPIMGRIAAELSDYVVATSDNPRSEDPQRILGMVEAGVEEKIGTKPHEAIIDRREAIFRAVELAEKDDIVIIAGKGHENYQILADKTIHFDDKEVALEAIRAAQEKNGSKGE